MDDKLRWQVTGRLIAAVSAIAALVAGGATGYILIEGMSVIDAVYMAVITISTVGFGEVEPLSPTGRAFTVALIVSGAGVVAYGLSTTAELVFAGEWREYFAERRRSKQMQSLTDHTIICGYGRMGRHVADELSAQGMPFVVLDLDAEKVDRLRHSGRHAHRGNGANELDLRAVGIERARSLVATANSDAENVFIVLTAHSLRPDLMIVARANFDDSEEKLLRAGATRVLQPYRITGRRMAALLSRPGVADFLDQVMHANTMELLIDQVQLGLGSALAGKTLAEANLRATLGVTVLAVQGGAGRFDTSPSAELLLQPGATLIALGTPQQLQVLATMAQALDGPGARSAPSMLEAQ